VCREKCSGMLCIQQVPGSPLRVQGKVHTGYRFIENDGITPACAGKSFLSACSKGEYKDHPCVCREKVVRVVRRFPSPGSPLRVQGKANILMFVTV